MDRYGEPPLPAQNLIAVARFRVGAREAGLSDVALQGNFIKFSPAQLPESKTMRLNRMYPGAQSKPALDAVLIPKPKTARIGGRDLQDAEILEWANGVIRNIFSDAPSLNQRARRDGRTPRRVRSRGVGSCCLDGAVRPGLVPAGCHRHPDRRHGDGGDGPGLRLGPPLQHRGALAAAAVQRDCRGHRERQRRPPAGHAFGAGRGLLRAARRDGRRRSSCRPPWGLLSVGAGLLCMFMINIAAKALKLFPKSGWISNWVFALAMAGLVTWFAPHQWTWLPVSMLTGVVVHIVGDMVTTGGVPLLWPLVIKPPKFLRRLPVLKSFWRPNGALSIPLLGRAGSRREWLVLIPVSAYAMVGMCLAALTLAGTHFPAALALAGRLADSLPGLP